MYIRICFKGSRSFEQTIKDEKEDFEQNVGEHSEQFSKKNHLPGGREYVLNAITYKPVIETGSPFSFVASNQIHEQVAYLDGSDKLVILLVLTADSDKQLQASLPAFQGLLESFR